jgi:predicted acylesterase/phospholipase RssA
MSLDADPPRTLGLVLSGGGARGAFQVGAYQRLLDDPRFCAGPRVLSGTSAGSINAALIAAGHSPREMLDFWHEIAEDPPVVASARFFHDSFMTLVRLTAGEFARWLTSGAPVRDFVHRARNHLPPRRGSLLAAWVEYLLTKRFELVSRFMQGIREPFVADTAPLRARLVEALGGERVPANGIRLAINTVDAHTGRIVRFVNAMTPHTRAPDYLIVDAITVDMVLASASIPLLFPPVEIGPHLLWDGGILVNTPLAPVVALGADEIVTVLVTEPPDPLPGRFTHFGRAVERAVDSFLENAYNVDRKLLLERNRLARLGDRPYRDVTLYEVVRPARDAALFTAGSYLYFEHHVIAAMHRLGVEAAGAWLAAGPRIDRLEITEELGTRISA